MRPRALPSRVLSLVLAVGVAGPAWLVAPAVAAQEDLAAARQKFKRALALQTAGDWAGALALLREVANLRETPQVRFNIALCEENLGQLVAALGNFGLAQADAEAAKLADVASESLEHIQALEARIPKLLIRRGEGAEVAKISVDGVVVGDQAIDREMPLDPGPHVVEATAPGRAPFRQEIKLPEKATQEVTVVMLPAEAAPAPVAAPPPVRAGTSTAGVDEGPAPTQEGLPAWVPWTVGGVGVASLALSGVFFSMRSSAIADLDAVCGPSGTACPASAEATYQDGQTYTTLANVTLGLGVVGVGVGAYLLLTGAPAATEGTTAWAPVGPRGTPGASLTGRF